MQYTELLSTFDSLHSNETAPYMAAEASQSRSSSTVSSCVSTEEWETQRQPRATRKKMTHRHSWTAKKDACLVNALVEHKQLLRDTNYTKPMKNFWLFIASCVRETEKSSVPPVNGRQCRERFYLLFSKSVRRVAEQITGYHSNTESPMNALLDLIHANFRIDESHNITLIDHPGDGTSPASFMSHEHVKLEDSPATSRGSFAFSDATELDSKRVMDLNHSIENLYKQVYSLTTLIQTQQEVLRKNNKILDALSIRPSVDPLLTVESPYLLQNQQELSMGPAQSHFYLGRMMGHD